MKPTKAQREAYRAMQNFLKTLKCAARILHRAKLRQKLGRPTQPTNLKHRG